MSGPAGISWIIDNSDWLSASSGLISAVVFAWPLLKELAPRRFIDQLARLGAKRASQPAQPPAAGREDDQVELQRIADDLVRERLGGYRVSQRVLGSGLFFLFLSFLFNLVYAINKA